MAVKSPIATEKAIRIIETENTLLFEVDFHDNKTKIAKEFESMFNVKVEKVNTMLKGNKKIAFIKLNKKNPAINIATKLGVI